jgi:phosphate transport system permease protein
MTPPNPTSKGRLPINERHERRRAILDRSFRWVGFAATFFGLGMLTIFLIGLAVDVAAYFRETPARIVARNEEIRLRVADSPRILADAMHQLDQQLETGLARARTDQEKKELKELFESFIKPRKKQDMEATFEEWKRDLENIRTDQSAWALFRQFMSSGPSNHPEDAGILPALLGSIYLGLITILFAVPLGVGAALYLEEYGTRNWLAKLIQINISNLAGVPSVVFGILGAFLFVELIFKPMESDVIAARNVLGGGMTLALLTLPVVIVAAQEAIRAVPQSIRHGAYALGATRWQVTWTLVLPCATPGILTGTILALARAMGEAAPLVMFGALLFVNQEPTLFSRFTILPMQIFGWADRPDLQWQANAALASIVLLITLLSLNGLAIWQRARSKIRW